jgi:hypothetical protein
MWGMSKTSNFRNCTAEVAQQYSTCVARKTVLQLERADREEQLGSLLSPMKALAGPIWAPITKYGCLSQKKYGLAEFLLKP